MGTGSRIWALVWALEALLMVWMAETQGHEELSFRGTGPTWDKNGTHGAYLVSSSAWPVASPPISIVPRTSSLSPARGRRVCSTWGDFHFKTFDGAIFRFPGLCNYVFSAHCGAAYEDFNVQLRRSGEGSSSTISRIVLRTQGLVLELSSSSVLVDGQREELPYSRAGFLAEHSGDYVKVSVQLMLTFLWNGRDSVLLELDSKYANQTCGLCGDFNGLPARSEFFVHNTRLTPFQFGNLQKLDGPTEQCQDPLPSLANNCTYEGVPRHAGIWEQDAPSNDTEDSSFGCGLEGEDVCRCTLRGPAFAECNKLVDARAYVAACAQDLCHCPTCPCATFAEYSRQCAQAGGQPQNWRGPKLCPRTCPLNMRHQECGSPCVDTCSNPQRSQLCQDHCVAGCFCPPGMVLDDITHSGCLPLAQCPCTYSGHTYMPGTSFTTTCSSCTCFGGLWQCQHRPCPGTCSVRGGSHISTYDKKLYDIHGDCSYILSKTCADPSFAVLAELRKCGLTDTENCLRAVTLSLHGGDTTIRIQASGGVFVNSIYTQLPVSAANVTIFRPTSFFILVHTGLGLQLQVQLVPLMQVYVRLDPSHQGQMCGLCGNFNQNQADDFMALSGVVEGTGAAFANTWKAQAACPNVKSSFEDPCSLSLENEKYARHWCSLLTNRTGPFSACHSTVNPSAFHSNCLFDTCNCEKSEDCMCAALSSYVQACAAQGVLLRGWRAGVCAKYMSNCPKSQSYEYVVDTCPPTCRALSEADATCGVGFVPVDGCTCPENTFLNETGVCVPAQECPCYLHGTVVANGEVVQENGMVCSCVEGKLSCLGALTQKTTPGCVAPMMYLNCSNVPVGTLGAECLRSCHSLDMDCFSTHCVSGCVCPPGLVADGSGGCIAKEDCPCVHNEASYKPGTTIRVDCNTCTCRNRRWECSRRPCLGTCVAYGDGHFITFDGERYDFEGSCQYTLAQDYCGGSGSPSGTFRITTENVPCGTTGTTCSKAIRLFLGSHEMILHEGAFKVVEREQGGDPPYKIRYMGIFLVIETRSGLVVSWDRKTSVFLGLHQNYKGRVCGLCGNFDGNALNDFTTRSQAVVSDVLEFGNSWKFSPSCPDALAPRDPCTTNPYRKAWAQKQCSVIHSATFTPCHSQVDSTKYYEACVGDACACDSGGDCECFCTAVAAYARACQEAGVCVSWRTPDLCPLFCDYYNPHGECEWHYQPCGAPCLRTCRNPSGRCLFDMPGLEGCYPKCPPSQPFFNEDQMKCVAQCGCYDEDGHYYDIGAQVPTTQNCQRCHCSPGGLQCAHSPWACTCTYEGRTYGYQDVIYNTTDGLGACLTATCGHNGTIIRRAEECPGTPATTPFTFTPSTTSSVPTPSTLCVREVCHWSNWYDSSRPEPGVGGGDLETLGNMRQKGYPVCEAPAAIECRAEQFPSTPLQELGQEVQCHPGKGLTCLNSEQSTQLCHNYQLRVLCCKRVPCGPSPAPGTSTLSSQPTATGTCQPQCKWTEWFDTDYPTSEEDSGDTETYESIKRKGGDLCEQPQDIECESELYPGQTLEQVGQRVRCDVRYGLQCRNREQEGLFPMCYNYRIRVLCCSRSHCPDQVATAPTVTRQSRTTKTSPGRSLNPSTLTMKITKEMVTNTTTLCQPKCEWTQWFDSDFPSSGVEGGDMETYENIRAAEGKMCQEPQKIECQAENYPEVSIDQLGQVVTCNLQVGLLCRNKDQTGEFNVCFNYNVRVLCCDTSHCPGPVTPLPTSAGPTSKASTTTQTTTQASTFCQPKCEWTQWFDTDFPSSGVEGGDMETYENIRAAGGKMCLEPQKIECRAEDYPEVSIDQLGQVVTCNPQVGLLCRNKDQTGEFNVCFNYNVRVLCCDASHCPGPATPLSTSAGTTSKASTTTQTTTQASTFCQPKCEWTQWFDTDFPSSGVEGGDMETYENIRAAGGKMCQEPQKIECRAEDYPEVSIDQLGQVVTCNLQVGLLCRNKDQTGEFNVCFNYNVRVLCCDASHCPGPATPLSTFAGPTSMASTTTQTTTQASTFCQPKCEWTQWFDTDFPSSGVEGGDMETYENIRAAGGKMCLEPQKIECRAENYPEVSIDQLGQVVTCNPQVGLLCRNKDQTGEFNVCFNYNVRVLCCDASHCPGPATPLSTSAGPTSKASTTTQTTTQASTFCQPKCEWTQWFDTDFPSSGVEGGDMETYENIRAAGGKMCQEPQKIECRAENYPEVSIDQLGQVVTCNPQVGLLCRNKDQTGEFNVCFNYNLRVLCCDTSHCPGSATPLSTSAGPTSKASTTTQTRSQTRTETTTQTTSPTSTQRSTEATVQTSTNTTPQATAHTSLRTSIQTPGPTSTQTSTHSTAQSNTKTTPQASTQISLQTTIQTPVQTNTQTTTQMSIQTPSQTTPKSTTQTYAQTSMQTTAQTSFQTTTQITAQTSTLTSIQTTAHTSTQITTQTTANTIPQATTQSSTKTTPQSSTHFSLQTTFQNPVQTSTQSTTQSTTQTTAQTSSKTPTLASTETNTQNPGHTRTLTTTQTTTETTTQTTAQIGTETSPQATANSRTQSTPQATVQTSTQTSTQTTAKTTTQTSTQTSTFCQPKCEWTQWFDSDFPSSGLNGGDMETYENIRAAGGKMCQEPQKIECRAEDYPEVSIDQLGQVVTCNPQGGLLCRNKDQTGEFNVCFNYNVRVLCCDTSHCSGPATPLSTFAGPTSKASTTTQTSTQNTAQASTETTPPVSAQTSTLISTQTTGHTSTQITTQTTANTIPQTTTQTTIQNTAQGTSQATAQTSTKTTPQVTAQTSTPSTTQMTAKTTTQTSTFCQPKCEWTQWFDSDFPSSGLNGGDMETYENIRAAGGKMCLEPQKIECRAEDYPEVSIDQLGQVVTCNPQVGLLCRNKDQTGEFNVCFNYNVRVLCCDASHCPGPATPLSTSAGPTSMASTTTQTTTQASTFCQPKCEWTQWFDTDFPSSGVEGGDMETYENIRAAGGKMCQEPQKIECRAENYPEVSIDQLGQVVTCNPQVGLLCRNKDQTGEFNVCFNYNVRVLCCDASHCPGPATPLSTFAGPTSMASTTTQTTTQASTFCQPKCEWTQWFDTDFPSSGVEGGDMETYENIRAAGGKMCQEPQKIECRAEDYPEVSIDQLGQVVTCNPQVGLLCRNKDQTGEFNVCFNYNVRVLCCDASHCPGPATPLSTSAGPTSKASTTTQTTTQASTFCQPKCEWTQWFDTDFPSSGVEGGDMETYENIRAAGGKMCLEPQKIECRAENYPEVSIDQLGQVVTCNLQVGLLCRNKDQTGEFNVCFNYNVRVLCCDASHLPGPATPLSTSAGPTSKASTTTQTTTQASTFCQPKCEWTQWFDTDFPSSGVEGGDMETYENIRAAGGKMCLEPQKIECRAENYPEVSIDQLGQVVTCNPQVGLLCRNKDQTGEFNVCFNYNVRVLCCDASHCPGPATPLSTSAGPTSKASTTTQTRSQTRTETTTQTTSPTSTHRSTEATVQTSTNTTPQATAHTSLRTSIQTPGPTSTQTSTHSTAQSNTKTTPQASTQISLQTTIQTPVQTNTQTTTQMSIQTPSQTTPKSTTQTYAQTSMQTTAQTSFQTTTQITAQTSTLTSIQTTAHTSTQITTQTTANTIPQATTQSSTKTTPQSSTHFSLQTTFQNPVQTSTQSTTQSTTQTTAQTSSKTPTLASTETNTQNPGHTRTLTTTQTTTETTTQTTAQIGTETSPQATANSRTQSTPQATVQTSTQTSTQTTAKTTTQTSTQTSTFCQPKCEWTQWFDSDFPSSGLNGGDMETYENIRAAGGKMCQEPQKIECRAEDYPEVSIDQLGQVVTCNPQVGLLCRNKDQTGEFNVCFNYNVRVLCCDASHCPGPATPLSTSAGPTSKASTTTQTSTQNTAQASTETTPPISAQTSTLISTQTTGHTSTQITTQTTANTIPQTTTQTTIQNTAQGTSQATAQTSTKTTPQVTAQTSTPSTTQMTAKTTTQTSTFCQPKCEWTQWFDSDFPSSGLNGGDMETYENIRAAGGKMCLEPQKIECRAEDYPEVSIDQLGQVVTCNPQVGLLCRNKDQTGEFNVCFNYNVRVLCCDASHCPGPATPLSTSAGPTFKASTTTQTSTQNTAQASTETSPLVSAQTSTLISTQTTGHTSTQITTQTTANTIPQTTTQTTIQTTAQGTSQATAQTSTKTTPQVTAQSSTVISTQTTGHSSTQITTQTTANTIPQTTAQATAPTSTETTSQVTAQNSTQSTTQMTAKTTTQTSTHTSTFCQPKCEWTQWFDSDFPSTGVEGGDMETYENIRAAGDKMCQEPQKIECRAENYPEVSIDQLGQVVTCNPQVGLLCRNKDQTGEFNVCFNYNVRVLCCDASHCPGPATPLSTSAGPTSKASTTTQTTTQASTFCQPKCEWTQWFDSDFPSSGLNGGDMETYENIRDSGGKMCLEPQKIECRAENYPEVSIDQLGQVVTCNPQVGLLCRNKDQTGEFNVCFNYNVRVLCCDASHCPGPATPLSTSAGPTSKASITTQTSTQNTAQASTETTPPVSAQTSTLITTQTTANTIPQTTTQTTIQNTAQGTSQATAQTSTKTTPQVTVQTSTPSTTQMTAKTTTQTSTFCQPKCEWTQWFDSDFPSSGLNGGDMETYENIRAAGGKMCLEPQKIECRAEDYPEVSIDQLGQVVTCNPQVGLLCRNKDQTGEFNVCFNYNVRVLCCDASHCPGPATPLSTSAGPTFKASTTTQTSTQNTAQASTETSPLVSAQTSTLISTQTTGHTSTQITTQTTANTIPQTTTQTTIQNTAQGTSQATAQTSTKTTPQVTAQTSTPSTTQMTAKTTTQTSTFCQPKCEWTQWFDSDFPSSGLNGGDMETYENIRAAGGKMCQEPQKIECRAEDYPEVSIDQLGQVVTCNPQVGLLCRNKDQTGEFNVCFNYNVRVLCCDASHCPGPATPLPPSVLLSTPSPIHSLSPTGFSISATPRSPCFCTAFGRLFSAGDIIYNETDSAGCNFRAVCTEACGIERFPGTCPTSSSAMSSPAVSPPSEPLGCDNAVPPRQVNESWTLENCTVARCEGNNRVVLLEPVPVASVTCVNQHLPVRVWNQSQPCLFHYECECLCSRWGSGNFMTFDGTWYSFTGNCTYTLLREIQPRHGNLSIRLNNHYCRGHTPPSCPHALQVYYESTEIILTTTTTTDSIGEESLILFNQIRVSRGFTKNGISVSVTGATMMGIHIPAVGVSIAFNGHNFQIRLPYGYFGHNTEGQCGTCTNSQSDDCRRPDGTIAPSCQDMAKTWVVPGSSREDCQVAGSLPVSTSPQPPLYSTPSSTPCPPAPLCKLMLSQVFAECHSIIPPGPFFQTCVSDSCQDGPLGLCQNLEIYAASCRSRDVCVDWRNATSGLCDLPCPPTKVYRTCGPMQPASCDSRTQSPLNSRLAEGCFCPEDQLLFSLSTDICVPECSCVGPDGSPKFPGEQWVSNCQSCECDEGSASVRCRPVQCKAQGLPLQCGQPGFIALTRPQADNPCCSETLCVCNVTTCPQDPPECEPGQELTYTQEKGSCCPNLSCRPKLCNYNGTVYGVGATFPGVIPCHTCICVSTGAHAPTVQCEEVACTTTCPEGFEYSRAARQCVPINCFTPEGQSIQPNETWVSSHVDNCTEYRCEAKSGVPVLTPRPKSCPDVSNCRGILRKVGCCYSCEERDPCQVRSKLTILRYQGCETGTVVNVTFCEGSCPGVSKYMMEAQAMQHQCTCCQERKTHQEAVTMRCPSGTDIQHTYTQVDECSCSPACLSVQAPVDTHT